MSHSLNSQIVFKKQKEDKFILSNMLFKMKIKNQMKKLLDRTCVRRYNLTKLYSSFLNDKASEICQENNHQLGNKVQNLYQNINMQHLLKQNEKMQAQYKKELMQKKQKYQYFKELIYDYIINYPVFNPSSSLKLMWDFIVNIICITIMFFIPICFLYSKSLSSLLGNQLNIISPFLLIFDFLIKLNTGFYTQGQMCKSRIKILVNFLKFNWFSDLVPLLIYIINFFLNQIFHDQINLEVLSILLFLFFTRITQLLKMLQTIEERFQLNLKASNMIQLLQVFILILFVSHFFASFWLYLGLKSSYKQQQQTWLNIKNIEHADWTIQYLQSYYYATVTMITVGYGDITPQNPQETIFCIFSMMICCGVFAYSINQVGKNKTFQVNKSIQFFNTFKFIKKSKANKLFELTYDFIMKRYQKFYVINKSKRVKLIFIKIYERNHLYYQKKLTTQN